MSLERLERPVFTESRRTRTATTPERWAALALLREAILRLHYGWESLPREARSRWWWTLLAGYAAVLCLTVALVRIAQAIENAGALAWEVPALEWLATDLPISFSTAMWLEGVGNGFVLWGVVLYVSGILAWKRLPLLSIALLLGYSLVYPVIFFGWWLWDRGRPTLILDGLADPGGLFRAYPSGHMVQTAFAYGFLICIWITRARANGERLFAVLTYLFVLATVALGRLRIGVHWPSDVAAGALIGIGCLGAVLFALRRAAGKQPAR